MAETELCWTIVGLSVEGSQTLYVEPFLGSEDDVIERAVMLAKEDVDRIAYRIEGPSVWDSIRIEQDDDGEWVAVPLVPDLIHQIPNRLFQQQPVGAS